MFKIRFITYRSDLTNLLTRKKVGIDIDITSVSAHAKNMLRNLRTQLLQFIDTPKQQKSRKKLKLTFPHIPGYVDPPVVEQQWTAMFLQFFAVFCFSEGLKPVDSTFANIFFYSWTPGFLWSSYWSFFTIWDPFELQVLYLAVSQCDTLMYLPMSHQFTSWNHSRQTKNIFVCNSILLLDIHDIPRQRFCKTSSCWMHLLVLFHVLLGQAVVDTTMGINRCSFALIVKVLDDHMTVLKTIQ